MKPRAACTFIRALQALVTSHRDPTLADAPELAHRMAAELLSLIDPREKQP